MDDSRYEPFLQPLMDAASKLCKCKLPSHPGLSCDEVILALYNKYIDKVKVTELPTPPSKPKGRV